MRFGHILSAFLGLVFFVSNASATITHVPSEQPTIQAGIDAASEGDTVLVADGTYTGEGNRDIDFGGRNIYLKSENGPEVTIIDCESNGRGFNLHSGESTDAVIEGLTIRGGFNLYAGGGIYCDNAGPSIINNIIVGNHVSGNNDSWLGWYGKGGGIFCHESSAIISNNVISGNGWDFGGWYGCYGGGIYCLESNPVISNNAITGNMTGWSGDGMGGGIYLENSSASIVYNIISSNYVQGICCWNSNPIISNNTITWHTCSFEYCSGSGLVLGSNSSPSLANNIIAFNDLGITIDAYDYIIPALACCDIYGNEGGDWLGAIADQKNINGNFSANPQFCDLYNEDYHISSYSPCAPANNINGQLIGALGVNCSTWEGSIWHVSLTGDDLSGDGSESNPFATIQHGINTAAEGDLVIVHDGTYTGEGNRDLNFGGKNIYLKSENGPEVTIIDCGDENLDPREHYGILFEGNEDMSAIVDGFTIKDGYFGIKCVASAPTIKNNIISNHYCNQYSAVECDGNGIICINCGPQIISNIISYNYAGRGGGILCIDASPLVSANNIFNNRAVEGAGIACQNNSNPIIENNEIIGNHAVEGMFAYPGMGGAIYCNESSPQVIGNMIYRNSARGEYWESVSCICLEHSSPVFSGNIIAGNINEPMNPEWGFSISCYFGEPQFNNNTISNNTNYIIMSDVSAVFNNDIIAFNGGPTAIDLHINWNVEFKNTDIFGNFGGDWDEDIIDQLNVNGNMSVNPLFCDTANGDYHISSSSLCAPSNNTSGELIGALEVNCQINYPCADVNLDDIIDINDIIYLINYYFAGGPGSLNSYGSDINCDGVAGIVDIVLLNSLLFGGGTADCCQ